MGSVSKDKIKEIFLWCVFITCAVGIIVTGIIFKQSFVRILPICVSLVVGKLQAKASRFSYLLGGINCIIYTVVFVSMGLYASAASTLFFSCPLQLVTFWRWSKRTYKQATEFRRMNMKQWCVFTVLLVTSFVVINFILGKTDSQYAVLDNLVTLFSTACTLLSMFCFREFSWLAPLVGVLMLTLYAVMAIDDPAQITYIIYAINCTVCSVLQLFSVHTLYAEQRAKRAGRL